MTKMTKKTAREALSLLVKNFNGLTDEAKPGAAKRINELEERLGYAQGYFTGIIVSSQTVRPLSELKIGDMLTPEEAATHFGGKAGWNGGVYVCDGAHKDGTSGFKVLEVRSSRPSWSF